MTPTIISFGKEGGGAKLLFNGKILKRKRKILPPNRGYLAINPKWFHAHTCIRYLSSMMPKALGEK
jgi:hypothetical protein